MRPAINCDRQTGEYPSLCHCERRRRRCGWSRTGTSRCTYGAWWRSISRRTDCAWRSCREVRRAGSNVQHRTRQLVMQKAGDNMTRIRSLLTSFSIVAFSATLAHGHPGVSALHLDLEIQRLEEKLRTPPAENGTTRGDRMRTETDLADLRFRFAIATGTTRDEALVIWSGWKGGKESRSIYVPIMLPSIKSSSMTYVSQRSASS